MGSVYQEGRTGRDDYRAAPGTATVTAPRPDNGGAGLGAGYVTAPGVRRRTITWSARP